eukprot:CAMPEP_0171056966 /NCGR_PEP_ID=MMETSP0766_2-20121228/1472_1 /TAXON_ID=439317 /ORGANISM="Gambierdiscus australes, Strain CAWD 149" /LENGTH=62 /DNA_ID=CAMNT_0011511989 /DNA_START=1 /DNA_END=189 /DNA_ORIENTATION=-
MEDLSGLALTLLPCATLWHRREPARGDIALTRLRAADVLRESQFSAEPPCSRQFAMGRGSTL